YYSAFEHRFGAQYEETVQPLLSLVMAAPGPLPLALAAEVLGCGKEEARKMRLHMGAYLVEGSAGLSLFHKTLGKWLGSEASGVFFTDSESDQRRLGEFLWGCFMRLEQDDTGVTKTLEWESFVLEWLMKLLPIMPQWEDWDALSGFGEFYRERTRYEVAEALLRRALEGIEKTLGAENPDTLVSVTNLGDLLNDKGDYEGAEKLLRRALHGLEKSLGAENPDTLVSVTSLGLLLCNKGNYEEAEVLFHRALVGKEKVLGADHVSTLSSVMQLGVSLQQRGDCEGAEALYRRAFEGFDKVYGGDHINTLLCLYNLSTILHGKGDYEEAEALHRRVLEIREKVLGAEHPHTLISVNSLGSVLYGKGDHEG
ncbi:MAG: tetratricopeptide repeat protein, partial [Chthoniobacteraceae bacterium]|nr:tetratricopeptide repeat protein [Chthoniobacteraceae bacterium]